MLNLCVFVPETSTVSLKTRSYVSYVLYFLIIRTYYNVLYFITRVHIFGEKNTRPTIYNNSVKLH